MMNTDTLCVPNPARHAAVPHDKYLRLCWGSLLAGNGGGAKMTFQRASDHIEWR
jgi:hypothetical protein